MVAAGPKCSSTWRTTVRAHRPCGLSRFLAIASPRPPRSAKWRPPLLEVHSPHEETNPEPLRTDFLASRNNDTKVRERFGKNELLSQLGGPPVPVDHLWELNQALARNDSVSILRYMWEIRRDYERTRQIPNSTFYEILRQIHPGNSFLPLQPEYKGLGPSFHLDLSPGRRNFYRALLQRRQMYQDLTESWLQMGRTFGLNEYRQILNMARAVWDGETAQAVMKDMQQDGIQPDLLCYNYYLEARCWSDACVPEERHRLRIIPAYMYRREEEATGRDSTREKKPIKGHKVGAKGIRWEVSRTLQEMTDNGITPDMKSYIHLMTAYAREGDMKGVKSVLRQLWNIDTDSLASGTINPDVQPMLNQESPTFPTEEVLFTVAHAFGINNDVSTALRVVDHISSSYKIPIPRQVWLELIEWTYVLSRPKTSHPTEELNLQPLPSNSMANLYDVMRKIYKVRPTLLMYDFLIRHHSTSAHLGIVLKLMREAVDEYDEQYKWDTDFVRDYRRESTRPQRMYDPLYLTQETVADEEYRFNRFVSYYIINRWLLRLLAGPRWNVTRMSGTPWESSSDARTTGWQRRVLPTIVGEFWRFRGLKPIRWRINSGWVKMFDPDDPEAALPLDDQQEVPAEDDTEDALVHEGLDNLLDPAGMEEPGSPGMSSAPSHQ